MAFVLTRVRFAPVWAVLGTEKTLTTVLNKLFGLFWGGLFWGTHLDHGTCENVPMQRGACFFFRRSAPMQRGSHFAFFDVPCGAPCWAQQGRQKRYTLRIPY